MPRIGRNDPRKAYIAYWNEHLGEGTKAHGKEFDLFIKAVKAEALREAAEELRRWDHRLGEVKGPNNRPIFVWLRDRANTLDPRA